MDVNEDFAVHEAEHGVLLQGCVTPCFTMPLAKQQLVVKSPNERWNVGPALVPIERCKNVLNHSLAHLR